MSLSIVRHGWRRGLGALPVTENCLLLIDSGKGEIIAFSYVFTRDYQAAMSSIVLVKLNGSESKTKSHESGKRVSREEGG